jgi:flagellin FlaB
MDTAGNTTRWLDYVKLTISSAGGGTGFDITGMVVSYQDPSTRWASLSYAGDSISEGDITGLPKWGIFRKMNADSDAILETGEQFLIGIGVPNTAVVRTSFTINLQPPSGVAYSLKRTVPVKLEPVMKLV